MASVSSQVSREVAAVADLERRRLGVERRMRFVPYGTLIASVILVVLADLLPVLAQQPLPIGLGLAVLAAVWIIWFVTLHPEWEHRRRLMAGFFVVLVVIILV